MSNVIYAYRKKSTNKIVYVGQTVNIEERHKTHTEYDPFNINTKEYEYPLSRGIRKYGVEEYELIILEDQLLQEQLDTREKYWIRYYDTCFHGYNQTLGGKYPAIPEYNEQTIDTIIEMLQDYSYTFQDISEKTGVSLTHIYNINQGKRRKRDELIYPIRPSNTKGSKGLKFSPEECEKIHQIILENELDFKQIALKFNCSQSTIIDINRGKTKAYRLDNYSYPLRSTNLGHSISKKKYWKNKLACIDYPEEGSTITIDT